MPSALVPEKSKPNACRMVKPAPLVLTEKTVPPFVPDPAVWLVPNNVPPDNTRSQTGKVPSLSPLKECRTLNPVPLVVTLNTVPTPPPPCAAVPYKFAPDSTRPADGKAPSAPLVNV